MTPAATQTVPLAPAMYRRLFVHRDDVFAQQDSNGAYRPVNRPLHDADIAAHLAGEQTFGVYSIRPSDGTVSSVVFDLDTRDSAALETLCAAVERRVGDRTSSHLLEASGSKGFHVWLFFTDPVPAADAKAWAEPVRVSYKRLGTIHRADWPPLEIFPKQGSVSEGAYGNLVKLPFGVHAKSGNRSELLTRWSRSLEEVEPYPSELVPSAPPSTVNVPRAVGERLTPFPCVSRILCDGAGSGQRDNAMYHLAVYLRTHGLDSDLAAEQCQRANARFDPPLTDAEVQAKVVSAYARTRPGSCSDEWLRDFCPSAGTPECFATRNATQPATPSARGTRVDWGALARERRARHGRMDGT